MNINTVGIDLAKNFFQIHGANERDRKLWNKQLQRKQILTFVTRLPLCLIGKEACSRAHIGSIKLEGLGHTVKLMTPQFEKPYVKTNINGAA
jgi:transposase